MTQHIYTKYLHHDVEVRVRADLKGLHRDHCLCHECEKFAPGAIENCHIAAAVFGNCVKYNLCTPVWECPCFVPGTPKSEVPKSG